MDEAIVKVSLDVVGPGFRLLFRRENWDWSESVPPSPGDQRLHDTLTNLGIPDKAAQLLQGDEVEMRFAGRG